MIAPPEPNEDKMSAGAAAGLAFVCAAVVAGIIFLVYWQHSKYLEKQAVISQKWFETSSGSNATRDAWGPGKSNL